MDDGKWLLLRIALILLFAVPVGWYTSAQVRVIREEDQEQAERRQWATELAAELAERLPQIQQTFQSGRDELRRQGYPPEGVADLLTQTEKALLSPMDGPDDAPLRDYVADVFRDVRQRLELAPRDAFLPARRRPVIRQAAFVEGETKGGFEIALDRIEGLLRALFTRAKSNDLIVTLCVISRPDDARFTMSAQTLPDRVLDTRTDGEVVNAFRGLYGYKLEKGTHSIACLAPPVGQPWQRCQRLDLWNDPPVLDCAFSSGACQHRERRRRDCPPQKAR
jgi:hypothetical protein